ncbi:hypothetical protein ID866_12909, partial [Astraeus odoratus]
MYHHLLSSAAHACACTLTPCTTTSHHLLPMPMCAPTLHTTTLLSSAAHAHACTCPAYHPSHHLPPCPCITPPIVCPH